MASLGKIFVELQLDDKIYKQKLSETLTSVQATAKGIETSWKALGTKSDAYFEAQRRSADNAYALIKNSAVSTTQDIIRAEQAKNAKIAALNKQQFGEHETLLQSLKNNWIAASAAIVASWMAVQKAVSYMDLGAKALQVESSFKIMAESSGIAAEKMIASMKKATKETIDDSDLMQKAVKLMTLAYEPEQIERFSKVVITAAQIAGTTTAEAYDNLADAIANRMPKALVRMGAVTKEQMKTVNAAIEAGAETTALYELAMTNLELKQKMLQGTQDQATISMQRFHATQKETTESIGKGLIVGLDAAIRSFQYLAAGVLGLVSAYAAYRALVYDAMGDEKKAAENREISNAAWNARNDLINKSAKAIFSESEISQKATKQEIADAKARVDAQMEELKLFVERHKNAEKLARAEEKITQEIEKTLADRKKYESTFYEWKVAVIEASLREYKQAGINETRIAELKTEKIKTLHAEMFKDYKKILADWEKDTHEKSRKTAEEMQKSSQEALTSYAEMYKGIKVRSLDLYEIQIELIEQQKEAFIRATNDEVAAEAWAMEQRAQKWIEYAQTTDDVMLGIKAGLVEMQRNLYTFGKAGYDMFKSFAQSSQNVISSVLFDGMKRQLKSFHDYWKSFTDALLKAFVDIVARMVVEWTTAQIFMSQMSFAGGFAGGAGLAVGSATGAGAGYGLTTAGLAGGAYMLTPGAAASTAYSGAQISSFAATIPDAAILAAETGQTVGVIGTNYAVTSAGETIAAAQATMPATAGWMAMASPYLASAGLGYLGGSLIGGAIYGEEHAQSSGIGAALGATAGMFIGGPVGAVIGGTLGGIVGGLFHEGGIVGESLVPQRQVPALAFAGAPRAHYGLGIDEVPIIAQRGERILSRRVTAEYESGASNRPIYLTLELDGKVLSRWMYKESKSGQNLIHVRGIVDK